MPANLPLVYQKAEAIYRSASTLQEKIDALQEMLRLIPHHKGTDKLIAQHRKKLSQLRQECEKRPATSRKGAGVTIPKEGAAQAALVGMPNSGKSSLVGRLTRAAPAVASYPFTTHTPTSGMMPCLNFTIQLIDTAPITFDRARSWLPNLIKSADALILVINLAEEPLAELETILTILSDWKIFPKELDEKPSETRFDLFFKPVLVLANKLDLGGATHNFEVLEDLYRGRFFMHAASAKSGTGLEDLKPKLFKLLRICRIYTKSPGKEADLNDPVTLPVGSTIEDFAESIHKDLRNDLKYARIWGSGKFEGQKVTRDHILQDEDIVELHA